MFAWIMDRSVNALSPVFGLPMVGRGSLAVQRSIEFRQDGFRLLNIFF
jgi:hypothetical protein